MRRSVRLSRRPAHPSFWDHRSPLENAARNRASTVAPSPTAAPPSAANRGVCPPASTPVFRATISGGARLQGQPDPQHVAPTRRFVVTSMFHPSVASSSPQRAPFRALASLALLALLAGCAGGPTGHSAGQVEPRQPPLEAKASFFADTVQATAQVSGFGLPIPGRGDRPGHEETAGGRPPGGRRGGLGHGPGGAGGPGGVGPGGPGGPRETSGAPSRPSLPRRGSEPRQTLRISFINTGTEPVEFTVAALRSAIGNFQPRPEHLTLAGGAAATLDPVSGDAGGALEWIDVTLSLRRTASTETRVLHLIRAAPPTTPSPL